jgi:Xaa-Pro aminopeptidase
MDIQTRVSKLQSLLQSKKLDGYVVPSADPHQSEYVADVWKRREFISGFSGSAGLFACTRGKAGLWTDGRYFIQAENELRGSSVTLMRQGAPGVPDWKEWMAQELPRGARLGVNLSLFSSEAFRQVQERMASVGIQLEAQTLDLIDEVWGEQRPAFPSSPLREHALEYAGESRESKLTRLRDAMRREGVRGLIVSALDEVAWLFNLRGADVSYNPVFYAFALVTETQSTLFVSPSKVSEELITRLGSTVRWGDYDRFMDELSRFKPHAPIWMDPATSSAAVEHALSSAGIELHMKPTPIAAWKARKNLAELRGMRDAHIRDGVAMLRFMAWFERAIATEALDELKVAEQLERFRRMAPEYIGPSFATIAGYGPNGALPHYRATPESCLPLRTQSIFLLDSGGQYYDGTTDITRTFACGTPTSEEKTIYTRVLKGHLLLKRSLFPAGTNGYQLDVLARQPLWSAQLDYGHGTGHGVGAALCVHEGPFSVSLRKNLFPLEVGAVLSNEPACYRPGRFGVRIENLVTVVEHGSSDWGSYLGMEDLTLCPYERRLIDASLLQAEEIAQVDAYHQLVAQQLRDFLQGDDLAFLERATAPLGL